ncbi:MAG: dTDP-4-amino-4,6-dideoxygalactose transaminase [Saprospiraceae bacterium]|nr:dTDP-4-amino-4,6-dideoxygalactose transaminase [Saprospiraceae bacterium]
MVPFNKPYLTGKEAHYLYQAACSGHLSGNGYFTKKCQHFFEERYGFGKSFLTTSCTAALEMAALLCEVRAGDEVIMPAYTFVSTANAFVLRGAKIVFADSHRDRPGIDEDAIEALINERTKVIVPVHYAGVACDMDKIMALARKYGLWVVEDAAQAVESFYTDKNGIKRALGSIGHLAAFSFHETKNITSGEGGMLVVNEKRLQARAEIIWEKGTNRSAFFRGEVDKYGWIDVGSSFLPSEISAAFLWAQLENLDAIQQQRTRHWTAYCEGLQEWANRSGIQLPLIPEFATNNAHMFYMVCRSLQQRTEILQTLNENGVHAVFHYLGLHNSPYYRNKHDGRVLPESDRYSDCLFRLPMFFELDTKDVIAKLIALSY